MLLDYYPLLFAEEDDEGGGARGGILGTRVRAHDRPTKPGRIIRRRDRVEYALATASDASVFAARTHRFALEVAATGTTHAATDYLIELHAAPAATLTARGVAAFRFAMTSSVTVVLPAVAALDPAPSVVEDDAAVAAALYLLFKETP